MAEKPTPVSVTLNLPSAASPASQSWSTHHIAVTLVLMVVTGAASSAATWHLKPDVFRDPTDVRCNYQPAEVETVSGWFNRYAKFQLPERNGTDSSDCMCEVKQTRINLLGQQLVLLDLKKQATELRLQACQSNLTLTVETHEKEKLEAKESRDILVEQDEAAAENLLLLQEICDMTRFKNQDCLSPVGKLYREYSQYAQMSDHYAYVMYEELAPRVQKWLWSDGEMAIEAGRLYPLYEQAAFGHNLHIVMEEIENNWRVSHWLFSTLGLRGFVFFCFFIFLF